MSAAVTIDAQDDGMPSRGWLFDGEIRQLFDEDFYLASHPDVAAAVQDGRVPSGWQHYEWVGHAENRVARIGSFEPHFYMSSYPMARREIAAGLAGNPLDHYRRIGRHRGYLGGNAAPRPDDPTLIPSRFGGMWPDQPNAADLIQGRLEIGRITAAQADLLHDWCRDGYVVLKGALSGPILDHACDALESAYAGGLPRLSFESVHAFGSRAARPWQKEVADAPAKALDLHFLSGPIRDAIFAPAIAAFMELVFESRSLASQSLGFYRGSAQEGHQDTAYVAYTMPRRFVASWIALEDVTLGAGELFYYRGSHRLDDYLYGGAYKTIHDFRRMSSGVSPAELSGFVESLKRRAETAGMPREPFAAKRGDVLLWHADLVHGGNPISNEITRKSLVTHYCPSYVAPLYFEGRNSSMYRHGDNYFSSSLYGDIPPGDLAPGMTV